MGGSRVDCMTPQKAIRTVFFNWSSAAIASSSVGSAMCMTIFLEVGDCVLTRAKESPDGRQAFQGISELEQFQNRARLRSRRGQARAGRRTCVHPMRATGGRSVIDWPG